MPVCLKGFFLLVFICIDSSENTVYNFLVNRYIVGKDIGDIKISKKENLICLTVIKDKLKNYFCENSSYRLTFLLGKFNFLGFCIKLASIIPLKHSNHLPKTYSDTH